MENDKLTSGDGIRFTKVLKQIYLVVTVDSFKLLILYLRQEKDDKEVNLGPWDRS